MTGNCSLLGFYPQEISGHNVLLEKIGLNIITASGLLKLPRAFIQAENDQSVKREKRRTSEEAVVKRTHRASFHLNHLQANE